MLSVGEKVKQYIDSPYSREVVDKSEVLALIREVLGFSQGEANKLVYDGKITPVVVLNDTKNILEYNLVWTVDAGVADSCRDILVDNMANVWYSFSGGQLRCRNYAGTQIVNQNVLGRYCGLQINSRFGPPYFDGVFGFSKNGRYLAVWNDSEGGENSDQIIVYDYGVELDTLTLNSIDSDYHDQVGGVAISPNGKYIALASNHGAGADLDFIWLFEGVLA